MKNALPLCRRGLLAVLPAVLIAGCATPPPKDEVTPKLYGGASKEVALSVIDFRSYVLSGDKTPKFEGTVRSSGIPITVNRPGRPSEETFADLLADMIREGLAGSGVSAKVVKVPAGSANAIAVKSMAATGANRYIIMRVNESKWDGAFNFRHVYDLTLFVTSRDGTVLGSKTLAGDEARKASDKYNVFDMHSVAYKELVESLFADPSIRQALQQ